MKLGADGVLSTYREQSNAANGLLIDPQGRLIACEGRGVRAARRKVRGTPRVTRTDLKTGAVEVLADSYEGKPLVGPNDVTIDGQGRLYFTELNGAAVYRIDAAGQDRADSRRARRAQSERHPGLARRPDAVPGRGQRRRRAGPADPPLRPPARRHGPQHARALRLLAGPQRRRHEHRHPGQSLRRRPG